MDEDIAIEVKDLHKSFVLPHEKISSVKSVFTNFGIVRNRKYEKQQALKGVSFTVKKGEFFGIVGRNGSGKSTLLKILAGIYQPSKGSVQVNGKIVPFIELGVGFNPALSGRDNVYLNGAMLGFSDKEVDDKYEAIIEFAELERFMDQKLKNYSSGMQVRLAFSVATVLAESDVLLLDEVLAVGDADFQRKCFSYFKTLKKLKKTVIFVSHDMNAIREYCDRAAVIDRNEIIYVGTSDKAAVKYTKLFNANKLSNASDEDRWGDGSAVIKKVMVNKKGRKDCINIAIEIKAIKAISDPVFGFLIRNESGEVLFGTNTKILKVDQIGLDKGEELNFNWEIPNIFNTGSYSFTPSIVYEGTMRVADWWESASRFSTDNEFSTPYAISPEVLFIKNE